MFARGRRSAVRIAATAAGFLIATIQAACVERSASQEKSAEDLAAMLPDQWELRYSFGALDSPKIQILGDIQDAVFDVDGRLFVLDRQSHRILKLAPDGTVEGSIDRAGNGPGELSSPDAIVPLDQSQLAVVTFANFTFQLFSFDGTAVSEIARFRLPFRPNDACAIGGRLFVLGYHDGAALHEIDRISGALLASFPSSRVAESADTLSAVARIRMTEAASGRVYCTRAPEHIVHAPESLGWVRSYNPDGEVNWTTKLNGFVEVVRVDLGDAVRYDIDKQYGYANAVRHISAVGSSAFVLRLATDWSRASGKPREFANVYLDLQTGKELLRQENGPAILDAGGSLAVTIPESEFPMLQVWRR